MKQSVSQLLLSAAAVLPSIYAQVPAIVEPQCVEPLHTIVYEYPAYFSSVFQTAGTIYNFFGGSNSLVINNPPQTVVTSGMLTTTIVTTATKTVTALPGAATAVLGAGIPRGTVTSIPSSTPFVLAFIVDAVSGRRPKGFASGNGTDPNAEDATQFYLQDGQLRSTDGGIVGRNRSDTSAPIVATQNSNEITRDFSFVDGELRWNSPDRGAATFYNCPDGLYAGFPNAPSPACVPATIGGVAVNALLASDPATSTTSVLSGTSSTGSSGSSSSASTVPVPSGGSGSSSSTSSRSGSSGSAATSVSPGTASITLTSNTGSSTDSVAISSSGSSSPTTGGSFGISSGSSLTTSRASSVDGSSTISGSATTVKTSSTTTKSPDPTAQCPPPDGVVQNILGFLVGCGKASVGLTNLGDFTQEDSLQACIETCYITDTCVSVDFKISGGFCYLHDAVAADDKIIFDAEYNYSQLVPEDNGGDAETTTQSTSSDAATTFSSSTLSAGSSSISASSSTAASLTTSASTNAAAGSSTTLSSTTVPTSAGSSSTSVLTSAGSSSSTTVVVVPPTSSVLTTTSSSSATTSVVLLTTSSSSTSLGSTSSSSGSTTSTSTSTSTSTGTSTGTSTSTSSITTTSTTTTTTTTTTSTSSTTTTAPAVGQPGGGSNKARNACTAGACPAASNGGGLSYRTISGTYYAIWSMAGLNAENFDVQPVSSGTVVQSGTPPAPQFNTLDECATACNTAVDRSDDAPCVSVSFSTGSKFCYFHRTCRDTNTPNGGVNTDMGFQSAEKNPAVCSALNT